MEASNKRALNAWANGGEADKSEAPSEKWLFNYYDNRESDREKLGIQRQKVVGKGC